MTKIKLAKRIAPLLVASASGLFPGLAFAGGFHLTEQSAGTLGQAHAGAAALADDATTNWYNPAGLTRLSRPEFLLGGAVIRLGADFTKQSAVDAIGQPLSGGEGGSVGKLGGIPFIYYATPLTDKLAFGIGFNVPFGLTTDYPADSLFRYQAIYSYVGVYQLNPNIAWKISDHFSVGGGIDVQRMEVKLTNDIDYGAACFGNVDPLTCTALGLTPQGHDGFVQLQADDYHTGYNFGLLLDYGSTRVGLSYRTRVSHDLSGSATFTNVPTLFSSMGLFQNGGASAEFTTPQITYLSLYQELDPKWSLTADIQRVGWSSFGEIRVKFSNPNQPDTVQPEGWTSTTRYSLGLNYKYNDAWTFRGGVAYDPTPVNDPTTATIASNAPSATRTPRLPDADRRWLAFGATWRNSDVDQWDIGYAHLFIHDNIPLNQVGASGDHIVGTYRADADILALSYRHQF